MTAPLPSDILNNCTGFFYCMANYMNTVTDGFFWVGALLTFMIILYLITSFLGTPRAIGFAGFVSITGSIFLVTMRLMTWSIASLFIVVGVVCLAILILQERT